ncbi:bifunctional UDP-sugar hydrolase/5'-nucleotidase UshA [Kingella kingae]|uniref:bifunctional UDP-sugar hydrolase/5'-nucleotidase UshA n=1 Tax=Kingella kingae TaxID=504 RepID=UPI00050A3351|nr:bifunctional UDP-sugar hydrolase/5'-nucleotidase UshA [Kingella kingae]MDK4526982.1 bifunctional UDP-sugar hydrolase/5'-nucleotidase UshA [Kingella kingae]MDK4533065.1 bifunctional UDP-sugar hydrolase/5'-nucleotidase UshA [Kingella kingae]
MKTKTIVLLTSLLFASGAQAYEAGKTYRYTVIHSNDTHGRFWANEKGEYGFAAQKTAIDHIRQEVAAQGGTVLVLHAGDINTGVPESDLLNARPDIEGLNAIKYDAMALGNHEFDFPNQLLAKQEGWAKFPFLSANIINKRTGRHFVKPHVVINRGGLKFGVVGLTTEETSYLGNPDYTKNVRFLPVAESAQRSLAQLNRQKVDVRIALTHLGYEHDVALAKALPAGSFNAIIGGHSHTIACVDDKGELVSKYEPTQACHPNQQNGMAIMQAGEWGKYIGRADFEFKDGQSRLVSYQLIPINLKAKHTTADGKTEYRTIGAEYVPNAALLAKLKTYQDQGDKLLGVKVGTATEEFNGKRELVRSQQMPLGQLIGRAQMERVQADVGVINSGNLRDTLPAGDITYKHILKVQPFGNTVASVPLTGAKLRDYLQNIVHKKKGEGAYPQLIGMKVQTCGADNTLTSILVKGKPLDDNQTYTLSVASYLAAGGDGYPVLRGLPKYNESGFVDAEIMKDYITRHSPVNPADYTPDVWTHSETCSTK